MVDVVRTRAELVNEAAFHLGVLQTGQTLATDDSTRINDKIDSLLLRLASDSIVEVLNSDEIPAEFFDALSMLLANNCANGFGGAFSKQTQDEQEAILKKTARSGPGYGILPLSYF